MLVDVASIALRTLGFIALLQAAGIAVFILLFQNADVEILATLKRWAQRYAVVAIPILFAQYLLEAGRMAGDMSGAVDVQLQMLALQSPLSVVLALRVTGLLAIFFGLRRTAHRLLPIGILLTFASFIFTGHTSTHSLHWFLALLLLVHLHAIAFWFGALPALYLITLKQPLTQAAVSVEKFSVLASWIVPFILVAGLLLTVELLPSIAALNSDYGRFLIAKVCGFALLMGFAAWNKSRLTPALTRGDTNAASSLRRSMLIEFVVIVGVIAVTVTMTALSSPEM